MSFTVKAIGEVKTLWSRSAELYQGRLVLGWVTIYVRINRLAM